MKKWDAWLIKTWLIIWVRNETYNLEFLMQQQWPQSLSLIWLTVSSKRCGHNYTVYYVRQTLHIPNDRIAIVLVIIDICCTTIKVYCITARSIISCSVTINRLPYSKIYSSNMHAYHFEEELKFWIRSACS